MGCGEWGVELWVWGVGCGASPAAGCGLWVYRGTSLIRNRSTLAPYMGLGFRGTERNRLLFARNCALSGVSRDEREFSGCNWCWGC